MNTKYNAAALAFALLATSSVAMNADTTSSKPVLTAKAAAADENVKAVNPVKKDIFQIHTKPDRKQDMFLRSEALLYLGVLRNKRLWLPLQIMLRSSHSMKQVKNVYG